MAEARHSPNEQVSQPTNWQLLAVPLEGSANPEIRLPNLTTLAPEEKTALGANACTSAKIQLRPGSAAVRPNFQGARVITCSCAGVSAPSPPVRVISPTYPNRRRSFEAKNGSAFSWICAP